jgi:hypothetical protein
VSSSSPVHLLVCGLKAQKEIQWVWAFFRCYVKARREGKRLSQEMIPTRDQGIEVVRSVMTV